MSALVPEGKVRRKVAPRAAASKPKAPRVSTPRRAPARASEGRRPAPAPGPALPIGAAPGLTEEEAIESAKYQVAGARPRLFEEERFIFPDTYGVNRIRLLVKDPEWLFVHWDVDPESLGELRTTVGERTVALSKLTLRVSDPGNGGMSVVLLPPGVRSWYVRADTTRRAYRAELGLTLPSGEFKRLAESNTVVTPRVGPSSERARRVLLYRQAQMIPSDVARGVGADEVRSASSAAGPWHPAAERVAPEAPGAADGWSGDRPAPGGASDTFGPGGASDVHRR
ncbi:MAG: DUF4912 domain-containing protein [Vicinamibacteria bacterium]